MTGESFWTQPRIEALTLAWNAGHSAREIAAVLAAESGQPVTKNMVVSKVHRLALPMHQPSNNWRGGKSKRPVRI